MAVRQQEVIAAVLASDAPRVRAIAESVVRSSLALRAPKVEGTEMMWQLGVVQTMDPFEHLWMPHFLRHDPAPDLANATIPILAIFGDRNL